MEIKEIEKILDSMGGELTSLNGEDPTTNTDLYNIMVTNCYINLEILKRLDKEE